MKWILAFVLALGFSCGHKDMGDDKDSTAVLKEKADLYSHGDIFQVERCDRATFFTHYASLGFPIDISNFEKTPGRLERDAAPCYPEFSKSEASREIYIGWLHMIWTTKDVKALDRLIAYGEAHSWVMGEGPEDLVNISPLAPMIYLMKSKMGNAVGIASVKETNASVAFTSDDTDTILSGFKGHVLASYLWLAVQVQGKLGPVGLAALKTLADASPGNPMYQALNHRFTDGKQSIASAVLLNTKLFPEDKIPQGSGSLGWGSCPDFLYWLITYQIMLGK